MIIDKNIVLYDYDPEPGIEGTDTDHQTYGTACED